MNKIKKHRHLLLFICTVLITESLSSLQAQPFDYAKYVNPFIGTGGHGHTFPGAAYPYGMVQLSPDTRNDNSWDGCSGYHFEDSIMYGFSHTHLSGTGCSDYGDILFTPVANPNWINPKDYGKLFNKKTEFASAGYYSVELFNPSVLVELTAGQRSGLQRYTWQREGARIVMLDLNHRDEVLSASLFMKDSVTICGYRISKAWAKKQHCYFETKLSSAIRKATVYESGKPIELKQGQRINSKNLVAVFEFDLKVISLEIHTGLSHCDEEGAALNRRSETMNFDMLYQSTLKAWDQKLSCIKIDFNTPKNEKYKFYTALYHVFIQPNVASDMDGRYRGMDDSVYVMKEKRKRYTIFSLWDTYRATHPLLTLVDPQTVSELCKTILDIYTEQGRLPVWELASNETDCMIGYHAVSVLLDAANKGIDIGDKRLALEAMIKTATRDYPGLDAVEKQGFIGVEDDHESVSKTLEYAYNDWCIARFAEMLNCGKDTVDRFYRRSLNYRNLFNPQTGFFQPRSNGGWLDKFIPHDVNNHFTEANSWQYSFYVPHDFEGLINLHRKKDNLEKMLDALFNAPVTTAGRIQADITGLIGQYAHGNEPSHHIPFLYVMLGKSYKADRLLRQICSDFYRNTPDGLIGNEDCGQMSAWFVMASMGIYPICPGNNLYVAFKPWLHEISLRLKDGTYTNLSHNADWSHILMDGCIRHEDIVNPETDFWRIKRPDMLSEHSINDSQKHLFVKAPILQYPDMSFKDSFTMSIEDISYENTYIKTPGSTTFIPLLRSNEFKEPGEYYLKIKESINESGAVKVVKILRPDSMAISSDALPNAAYSLKGIQSLNDGISGTADWRKGNWYGVVGMDVQINIDLLSNEPCDLELGMLQDSKSWIFLPSMIKWYSSTDGKKYVLDEQQEINDDDHEVSHIKKIISSKGSTKRYRRIIIKSYGKLPLWHPAAGQFSYFFIDEITKVKKK